MIPLFVLMTRRNRDYTTETCRNARDGNEGQSHASHQYPQLHSGQSYARDRKAARSLPGNSRAADAASAANSGGT